MNTKKITDERQATYGPARRHFGYTIGHLNVDGFLRAVPGQEAVINELIERGIVRRLTLLDWPRIMVCDKLARLNETPDHLDSWQDIGGYAWTAEALLEGE